VFTFGGYGWDEGELSGPTDVCAREGFRLFVVDAGNDRVQQFDIGDSSPEGVVFPFQTGSGFAGEELVRPYRMDVDDEGRIYICDSLCHCVWVFAPTGELIDRLGGLGGEPTRMRDPGGVAIGPQGRVYVADTGNRRIQVFDLLGNWLAAWGGDDTELLVEPTGIDVGPGGNVFVADAGASRVVVLTSAGVPLFRFGGPGDGPGRFRAPVDVAVTEDGRVYVVDEVRQVVERFRILRDAHPRQ
jgi:DNA-binding beta-propeller fold protein YncE